MTTRSRLAVVLHADVVGSTALVQRDERLAHERIRDAFGRLAQDVARYGGVVHERRGDALVAEFRRTSDGVAAALAFQAGNAQPEPGAGDELHPVVRIGISLGEVVVADHTLTGPDVVLAQRLEQLAPPGGICLSQAVVQSTPRRLPFVYEDLGEHDVKGFDEPVRAYAVALKAGQELPEPEPEPGVDARPRAPRRLGKGIAAAALAAILGGALWWSTPWKAAVVSGEAEPSAGAGADVTDRSPARAPASPLQPEGDSIAVLPFVNLSADGQQEYFADGMTDDLITDLSKVSGLIVIARTSTFLYKGQPEDVRKIGQRLGARYVVEGSVRRDGDQVRVNAQLIDTTTGHHVWAERYDARLGDIFALQDRITRRVVEALALTLSASEREALAGGHPASVQSYDLFLQGSVIFQRFSRDDTFRARRYLERAIELEPAFAQAHAMLAWTYVFEYTNGWSLQPEATLDQALALAQKSIALNERLPVAYFVRGLVRREREAFETALSDALKAIEIEPNYANAHVLTATLLYYAGRAAEGLALVERASRLNPHHPSNYPFHRGQALFILGRYEEAIDAFQRGLQQNPTSQRLRVWPRRPTPRSVGWRMPLGRHVRSSMPIPSSPRTA